ncbi:MAG: TrmH family RNA methyltransferase [Planctomycetota bacterium]
MLVGFRIVLVAPSGPANIGAVCRALANFGLAELVIVAPRCEPRSEAAVAYAAHGKAVLDAARIVADIPTALAGCVRTYASSSKLGLYRRQAAITPAAAAVEAVALVKAAGGARDERGSVSGSEGPCVAFAFGREDHGLKTEELLHFDRIVTIPADACYPVLNLAAAVAIVCYELHGAGLAAARQPALPMALAQDLVGADKKEVLFAKLFDALERVGFLFGQNPDHLKYALRHMFGRLDLTVNEADILIGLARQVRWYVDHHPRGK